MVENIQIATFEGGELVIGDGDGKSREAVLALPLNRLLVRLVRVPADHRDDPVAFATPFVQAMSPYPDEPLTVSCETVRETANDLIVIAAALPESATEDLAAALDAAKLNITRVDALPLGRLRSLWAQMNDGRKNVRRLLVIKSVDCLTLIVLDDDLPSAIRAIASDNDLRREIMLSLLEAEDFGGFHNLDEVVVAGEIDVATRDTLAMFAPVRELAMADDSREGIADRSLDPASLNALPDSWRGVLEETRLKAKLKRFLIIAGSVWALIMATLFGVPLVYGFMTDHQKALSKEHSRRYREVKEMREKVKLVQKYSDHLRGSLEILKAVSDRLPEGIELNSWNFRREEGVKFSGESNDAASVYTLKDRLSEARFAMADGEEGDPLFATVELTGPSASRGGKQRFDIECKFLAEEE